MNTQALMDVWQASETSLRNKPQKKQTSQFAAVVMWQLVNLLIQLSIGDEKRSLPLCAYVAGFGKSGHIYHKIIVVLTIWIFCLLKSYHPVHVYFSMIIGYKWIVYCLS